MLHHFLWSRSLLWFALKNPSRPKPGCHSPVLGGRVSATHTGSQQTRRDNESSTNSARGNYVWYDQAGEKQEKVSYFNVVAWRYVAENAGRTLEKGLGVVVAGRLEQRSYEDKEGNKRSTVELVADEIAINTRSLEAVTRRQKSEGGSAQAQTPRRTNKVPASVGADDEPF